MSLRGARALRAEASISRFAAGSTLNWYGSPRRGGTRTKGLLLVGMEWVVRSGRIGPWRHRGNCNALRRETCSVAVKIAPFAYRHVVSLVIIALSGLPRSFAAEQPADVPAWLQAHVGEGEGQIAHVVLQRARALYLQKVSEGAVKNPCYFAMDATRPGGFGRRFYVICEADRSFRAIPSGHGNGRNLNGIANFANGQRCAKNFSNAMDSKLTTGGAYVTSEEITSFKGYYRDSAGKYVAFMPLVRAVRRRRRHRKRQTPRHRRASGRVVAGSLSSQRSGQPIREPGRLRSVWKAGELRRRPQQRLHQLVAVGRRANHSDDEGQPTTLYIYPESDRHRRRRASGEGRPVAVARRIILERLLLERNPLSEILAERDPRADPRSIQEGSSGTAAAAAADLQGAVKFVSVPCLFSACFCPSSPLERVLFDMTSRGLRGEARKLG